MPGGEGYSSVAVADGRAITLVQRDNKEWCVAFDAAKQVVLFAAELHVYLAS